MTLFSISVKKFGQLLPSKSGGIYAGRLGKDETISFKRLNSSGEDISNSEKYKQ